MRFRRVGLQLWAIMAILWIGAVGVMAGSTYAETSFSDQVKLQQQAKDIRAAGGDPALYQWGGPIQIGQFTVPPVQMETPYFWQIHGKTYTVMGLSFPMTSLIVLEAIARLIEGISELRNPAKSRRQAVAVPAN